MWVSLQTGPADHTAAMCIQAWEDIGGRDFFFTTKCHQLLRDNSREVRGTGLHNLLGERVFKVVYIQGQLIQFVQENSTVLRASHAVQHVAVDML